MRPSAVSDAGVAEPSEDAAWQSLGTPRAELTLDFTLPTGQSFRWRKSGDSEYTGVLNQRLVQLRQDEDDVSWKVLARAVGTAPQEDRAVIREYFNLHECLAHRSKDWALLDSRFRAIQPFFPGARMLRQHPLECMFQFICSSNNHISRIHGMVERLCSAYGSPLEEPEISKPYPMTENPAQMCFYAFPTLQQLEAATEQDLRQAGFGYRAKFIVGSVSALLQKPGGGTEWLEGLRKVPYKEAAEALTTLPGIGPKVAACICLFSLDKHEAIPVDTHVWQLAVKYYTPSLKGKTLTPKLMAKVESALIERFGPYAGWAHNILFISDLSSLQHHLPPALRARESAKQSRDKRSAGEPSTAAPGDEEERKILLAAEEDAAEPVASELVEMAPSEVIRVRVKKEKLEGRNEGVTVTAVAPQRAKRKRTGRRANMPVS